MTREELYAEVWGGIPGHADRSVDVYVSRLRTKLSQALPDRALIHTHNGIGYRFSPRQAEGLLHLFYISATAR